MNLVMAIGIIGAIGIAIAVPAVGIPLLFPIAAPPARDPPPDLLLADWLTIDQVIVDMGLEPHRDLTWAVGRQMRDRYIEATGSPPPSERRPKTNGGGSHSKSVYPPWRRQEIEDLVRGATNMQS